MMQDNDDWAFDFAETEAERGDIERQKREERAAERGVKYPDVHVHLSSGTSGNAFVIASTVRSAIARGHGEAAAEAYFEEALAGTYDEMLTTTQSYVDVS